MKVKDLEWNSDNKKLFIIMVFGFIILIPLAILYINEIQERKMNNLTEIVREKSFDIQVKDAYNDRGIYILNNRFYLNSSTKVIGEDRGLAKDHSIFDPLNREYVPELWDISAPFQLTKKPENDTLKLTKNGKTIILLIGL